MMLWKFTDGHSAINTNQVICTGSEVTQHPESWCMNSYLINSALCEWRIFFSHIPKRFRKILWKISNLLNASYLTNTSCLSLRSLLCWEPSPDCVFCSRVYARRLTAVIRDQTQNDRTLQPGGVTAENRLPVHYWRKKTAVEKKWES